MIRNYLKTAWRGLIHQKGYAAIRILGLSIGLTVFMLAMLYLNNERSYDRWHPGLADVYRVGVNNPGNERAEKSPSVQFPLGTFLADECPEVAEMTRVRVSGGQQLLTVNKTPYWEKKVIQADANFFRVFPYLFLEGDAQTCLEQPQTAVITRAMGQRLFGRQDPVGKTILFNGNEQYTISAVIDKPGPSHLDFDLVLAYHSTHFASNWFMQNHDTYVKLRPRSSLLSLSSKTSAFYLQHDQSSKSERPDKSPAVFFEPVSNIHLTTQAYPDWAPQVSAYDFNPANQRPLIVFSLIGGIVLLLACINYANLAVAQGAGRAKESGVRKVMGASRRQLMGQYLGESFLQTLLAVLLAVLLIGVSIQTVNSSFQLNLHLWNRLNAVENGWSIAQLLGVILLVSLLSGAYPAFVLSGYAPIRTLRGDALKIGKGRWIRNGLIVFQYSIASCFIAVILVVSLQLRFMRQTDPGFHTEQVLRIQNFSTRIFPGQAGDRSDYILQSLRKIPGVKRVTTGEYYPGMADPGTQTAEYDGGQQLPIQFSLINFDYLKVLGMRVLKGRNFSPDYGRDTADAAVINEAAVRQLGWAAPIGKSIGLMDRKYRVIGVVQDSYLTGYENKVAPQIYMMGVGNANNFMGHSQVLIQVEGSRAAGVLKAATAFWKTVEPSFPVQYFWLDDDFAHLLEKYDRFGKLTGLLTAAALSIAVMGIFALSAFAARQRTKEIGIRKVLGASVSRIVRMLSSGFVRLVLLAIVIASPVAWWAAHRWLEDFAYHIDLKWWMFAIAGAGAVVIALATVSFQTIRAAVADPVDSLRDE